MPMHAPISQGVTAMLPPLVSVAQFANWVGQSIASDDGHVLAILRGASSVVRSYTGRTWVDSDGNLEAVPGDVVTVTLQVAERKWRNPQGYVQDTTGPYTVRYSEQTVQGMYLTEVEKDMLDPLKSQDKRPTVWTWRRSEEDPYLDTLVEELPQLDPMFPES